MCPKCAPGVRAWSWLTPYRYGVSALAWSATHHDGRQVRLNGKPFGSRGHVELSLVHEEKREPGDASTFIATPEGPSHRETDECAVSVHATQQEPPPSGCTLDRGHLSPTEEALRERLPGRWLPGPACAAAADPEPSGGHRNSSPINFTSLLETTSEPRNRRTPDPSAATLSKEAPPCRSARRSRARSADSFSPAIRGGYPSTPNEFGPRRLHGERWPLARSGCLVVERDSRPEGV